MRVPQGIVAIALLLLAACGGGGGGGGGGLSLQLSPSLVTKTFYPGAPVPFDVLGTVTGSVDGVVDVVIVDNTGVINPGVSVVQISDRQYRASFVTAAGLAPGRYQGSIQVTLCGSPGCSPVYATESLGYDFTVLPDPVLTALSPTTALALSGDFVLEVTGTGFVPDSVVRWNGTSRPTTFVSATRLTAAISNGDLSAGGVASITVANPVSAFFNPSVSNALSFTVTNRVPTAAAVAPANLPAGLAGGLLTITGSNFVPASTALLDGQPRQTNYVSGSELRVTITGNDTEVGRVAAISVRNPAPGGGTSNALSLPILNPVPQLDSLGGPISAGDPATQLRVAGAGFQPTSRIRVNGVSRATTYIAGELATTLAAPELADGTTYSISVETPGPGGGVSGSLDLVVTNPPPEIVRLQPQATTAGCASLEVAALGNWFVPSSVILWNGSPRPTSFVSSTQVTATISPADLAAAGTATLSVVSGSPGGGTTGTRSFTIEASGPVTTSATAYRLDPQHSATAAVRCPSALGPMPDWEYSFAGIPGYPLVAAGRVIVTSEAFDPDGSSELVALEPTTGSIAWGPVTIPGRINTTYANGRVFVTSIVRATGGALPAASARAYDMATGTLLWSQDYTGSFPFGGVPLAAHGFLYANVLGVTRALDQATGAEAWSVTRDNPMAPTASDSEVFLAGVCNVEALNPATGTTVWSSSFGCSGGGARVAVADATTVFARQFTGGTWTRFAGDTGTQFFTAFAADVPPIADNYIDPWLPGGTRAIVVQGGRLRSIDASNGQLLNNYIDVPPVAGMPLLVNRTIVVGTATQQFLLGIDADTGRENWRIFAPFDVENPDNINDWPLGGLAVGDGWLVVPTVNRIRAFRLGE